MDTKRRRLRRQQLDQQLGIIQDLSLPSTPKGGWLGAIREALGMSLESLGKRLGVSRQTAHELVRAENDGSLSIKRMRSAADALGCELVLLVVPRQPLEQMVMERAIAIARERVMRTSHSMALEDQSVSNERVSRMILEAAEALVDQRDSGLWA